MVAVTAPAPSSAAQGASAPLQDPSVVLDTVARGRALLEEGRPDAALDLLEAFVERHPDHTEGLLALAEVYRIRTEEASLLRKRSWAQRHKRTLERAVASDSSHPGARLDLADFLYFAPGIVGGDEDEALRQLEALHAFAPATALRKRASWALGEGRFADVVNLLSEAVSADPGRSHDRVVIGYALGELGQYEAGLASIRVAISMDPDALQPLYQLGRLAAESGLETAEGITALERFLARVPENARPGRAHGLWRLGQLLLAADRPDEAVAALEEAGRLDPELDGVSDDLRRARRAAGAGSAGL